MNYELKITQLEIVGNEMTIGLSGTVFDPDIEKNVLCSPKAVLFFDNGSENRRIPLVLSRVNYINGKCLFDGTYTYRLDLIYWSTRGRPLLSCMTLNFSYGNFYTENAKFIFNTEPCSDSERFLLTTGENKIVLKPVRCGEHSSALKKAVLPLRAVFYFITLLMSVCLIPWFLLEALLSFTGITRLHSSVKAENPLKRILFHVNARMAQLTTYKLTLDKCYKLTVITLYAALKHLPVKKNRITFISMRRNELSGNFAFVYDKLKGNPDNDIRFILSYSDSARLSPSVTLRFCFACAVSRVIVLDEFTPQIHWINLKKDTCLIQLWHACGAFKTFGFTRLGKPAGSPQKTRMHRSYDYVTVSSSYCKRCHSEGFGISDEKVIPTGIPRTDVFFDKAYGEKIRTEFFEKYPKLKSKKIILFAPTFRGTVKENAYYPTDKFNAEELYEALGGEYAIIVKHHPFVGERQPIASRYADVIIDLSDSTELNDLLFVSDIVITDYSSLIFEAALLKLPMLFYVFDLEEYVRERDFYFDLRLNSPGKLVYTEEQLITAIKERDFEAERTEAFTKMFFDSLDGSSSERTARLIEEAKNT